MRIREFTAYENSGIEFSPLVSHRHPSTATSHGFVFFTRHESASTMKLCLHIRNSGSNFAAYTPELQKSDFIGNWVHIKVEARQLSSSAKCYITYNDVVSGPHTCGDALGPDLISGSNLIFGDIPNADQMVFGTLNQKPMDIEVDRVLVYRGAEPSALYWDSIKPNC
jgi:hypothetical protein